ncbi:MAG: hypothetical protein HFK08_00725 [Clostridia bacterium]|nr:hypothetical protein [Clostridia bacterium]
MKKKLKIMAILTMTVCICLTLFACASSAVGKYECEVSVMGSAITMTLELKEGGEYAMSASTGGISSDSESGTYKIEGDKIIMTDSDGESVEGTISNKEIVISQDGVTMTFKKK